MNHTFTLANNVVKGWIEAIKGWLYEFFNPELSGYTNFDFGTGQMINIQIIIFGIFAGVLLASIYTIYVKNVIGAFVRKLLAEQCLSEDQAKTLPELGFMNNPFVRRALRGSLLASTVVHVLPEEAIGEENKEKSGEDTPTEVTRSEGAPDHSTAERSATDQTESKPQAEQTASDPDSTKTQLRSTEKTTASAQRSAKPDPAAVRYYIKEEKKHVASMRFNARGSGWPTFFFVLLISVICVFLIFAFLPQILRFLDNTISIFSVEGNTVK